MFYEIRTYRLRNGAIPEYLKVVGEVGITIQKKHLGNLVGYFSSEIGPINEIVHIWGFETLDDRQARRSRLAADPQWQAFLPQIRDLIVTAESKIMTPASFSPLGGKDPVQ
ncbi:NIPSNAP family protein [Rhizobium viscosum]|uniref:NIPSNAP family protein n=1 Tax=Rhizobium viscosum TaxID=1673 RepID=UPI00178A46CB|nr:NIPSNAP family protein [Rhizobium viscosum]